MNILEEIAEKRKADVARRKAQCTIEVVKRQAYQLAEMERADDRRDFSFPFKRALSGEGIHFICEVKKASPSKGIIAENFPYLDIAREYEQAGASAISVLTEPGYFLGRDEYLRDIEFTYTYMVFDAANLDEPIYIHDEYYTDAGYYLENFFYASDLGLSEFDPNVVYMMVVVDEAGNVIAVGTSDYPELEPIPQ